LSVRHNQNKELVHLEVQTESTHQSSRSKAFSEHHDYTFGELLLSLLLISVLMQDQRSQK